MISRRKPSSKQKVRISDIYPSPENDEIYGIVTTDNDLIDLGNDMLVNGQLEPVVITKDHFLVSGHRRYHAAKLVGIDELMVRELPILRSELSRHEFKKLLRRYNHQRNKNSAQRLNEKLLDIDPDIAHRQLIESRECRDQESPVSLEIRGTKQRKNISDAKRPMLNRVVQIVNELKDYWPLTVRGVHYQLLNDPPLRHAAKPDSTYTNNRKSYQDLVDLIARARLNGEIPFEAISDETRPVTNTQFTRDLAGFVDMELYRLFRGYRRDLMQSQWDHFEIVLEKMTLQNIIQPVANKFCMPMTVGRGYCSLEPRRQIVQRYRASGKDRLVLVVLSDHDPDGMEICESIGRSIRDDFYVNDIVIHKALITSEQVMEWNLSPNGMEAKESSSNYRKFVDQFGTDVYELEAVSPPKMQESLTSFIDSLIDLERFNEELAIEKQEAAKLQALKIETTEIIGDMAKSDMSDFPRGGAE